MSGNNKPISHDSPLCESFEDTDRCPKPDCHPHPTNPPPPTPCSCCFTDEKSIKFSICQFVKTENLNNVTLDCTGRLLDINVTLKNVCPNKYVNIAVLVYENNKLLSIKVRKIPTGNNVKEHSCNDLGPIKFCFAFDDLPCPSDRTFVVKTVANYVLNC